MIWLSRRRARSRALRAELAAELRRGQLVDDGHLVGSPKSAPRASLVGVELAGADLRWADLHGCDFRDADLSGARLDGADLSWASLRGADLHDASLGTARVVETDFQGANLAGVDLSRVTGLTSMSVRDIRGAATVRWPVGFDPSPPRVVGPLIHHPGPSRG